MHVVQRPVRRLQRRMYSPIERGVVSNVGVGHVGGRYAYIGYTGLGEVDGLFNIGKMFTRMFTFTPSSFKLKNIAGALGSAVTAFGTFGIAPVLSEFAGPSGLKLTKGTLTGAHSKIMPYVGYAAAAAAAVVGGGFAVGAFGAGTAGATGAATGAASIGTASSGSATIGAALGTTGVTTGGGFLGTVGSVFSGIGSAIGTGLKALTAVLPVLGTVTGGKGGVPSGGMTQAEYDAQQQAAAQVGARQQAEYDRKVYEEQIRQQQAQMYMPGMMQDTSYLGPSMVGQPGTMQTAYGDLRTPYTAVTEDGETVQVDPTTGQVIQPEISTPMLVGIGAVVLLAGWYFMSGSKASN